MIPHSPLRNLIQNTILFAFNGQGTRCITGSLDSTLKIWNVITGELIHTLPHTKGVISVAFSNSGGKILSTFAGTDSPATLWNLTELEVVVSPNIDQSELLQIFEYCIRKRERITANDEQWHTFKSLPKGMQERLRTFIHAPSSSRKKCILQN